ncbi:GNAT family N-acetyltransferase [Priestia taiwanensis]|uniref:Acetyltransferase n=1 Tax=Priestia taiwanensis TaxID=1347902 RepID=A0A917AR23_9BACI|nr:GNAT family N-acetyltransferase [Priestia taiwanensis]MBM7362624.1 putative N-acetyltransferase YhbS [Priestia taiwanensis]GGE63754.1 acetyltransferase [Priestia taiwanensis]
MTYSIEQLNYKDVTKLLDLIYSVGWSYKENELLAVMDCTKSFGHVNEDGQLVSSTVIAPYAAQLASVGLVIVHPDHQRKGLGQEIVEVCLRTIPSETPSILIATNEGKPLYEKLGFRTVSHVNLYTCSEYHAEINASTYNVFPYRESDLSHLVKLDEEAFGAKRKEMVTARIGHSKQTIVVKNDDGEVLGFGISMEREDLLLLAPVIATNDEIATLIIHHLAKGYPGKVRVDLPEGKEDYVLSLETLGFEKVAQAPIMMLGADELPKRNKNLYGISAQAFG